jgi:hypothetical protein
VTAGGVDERDRKIARLEDQRDFGAAEDDGIDDVAFDLGAADLEIPRAAEVDASGRFQGGNEQQTNGAAQGAAPLRSEQGPLGAHPQPDLRFSL